MALRASIRVLRSTRDASPEKPGVVADELVREALRQPQVVVADVARRSIRRGGEANEQLAKIRLRARRRLLHGDRRVRRDGNLALDQRRSLPVVLSHTLVAQLFPQRSIDVAEPFHPLPVPRIELQVAGLRPAEGVGDRIDAARVLQERADDLSRVEMRSDARLLGFAQARPTGSSPPRASHRAPPSGCRVERLSTFALISPVEQRSLASNDVLGNLSQRFAQTHRVSSLY